ncbi:MAG: chloride channel protein [Thermomicrobiales bacterium]
MMRGITGKVVRGASIERGLESTRALRKWVVLGLAIGVIAGLGAVVFYSALEWATKLLIGGIAGYYPPKPAGEGETLVRAIRHRWLIPVVTTLGALIGNLIVFRFAPEAEGHGTDAAIDSFHHKGGQVRSRIPPIKLIASAITIGSGGSGGREGPAAQISAGFGSLLATWMRLDTRDRRIAVATGMGAGIGAIFRAPLGGAVMAAEILYLHDLEVEALIPSLIASITGYSIFGAFFGWSPVFGNQTGLTFNHPIQLGYYALLGICCGLIGLLYARAFHGTRHQFHRLPLPDWVKPGIGGLAVGLMGMVIPQALHTGYGWVQVSMSRDIYTLPLWIILVLPFAKILFTSLSIGSGGSGGIFGPGMVIGGMVGAAFWRLAAGHLPGLPATPAPFVIVAMMALFGGIAHAPLAVMLMVAEMTGNLSLLAPAMVAVGLSYLIVGDATIYTSQLPSRADSPAHRYRYSFPLLSSLRIGDAMTRRPLALTPDATVEQAERALTNGGLSGAPVVASNGVLAGVMTLADVATVPAGERAATSVASTMTADPVTVLATEGLDDALEDLATTHVPWMPVVDAERHVLGVVTAANITAAYRAALTSGVRRLDALAAGTALLEMTVAPGARVAGLTLAAAHLPRGVLVVSLRRDELTVVPRGDTELCPGDVVTVVVDPRQEVEVRAYFGAPATRLAVAPS